MPRLAANLAFLFTERPLLERFGAAAAAGFSAVELQYPYEVAPAAVKAELARHGLTQLGINTPPGREGESASPRCPAASGTGRPRLRARSTMPLLSAGGRSIASPAACRRSSGRRRKRFSSAISRAPRSTRGAGVNLLIEPLNPRDRPDYFVNRVEHAADIVQRVGAPNLRIQFDFYHVQIVGGDLIRRFEAHLPLVGHVQVAAVPSRREPDEGEVNYREIFALLDRLGYAGFVGCEYRPRGRTEEGLAWARPYGVVPRG